MTSATMGCSETRQFDSTAYTVICKSGQRGTEYSDPHLAALAFLRARDQDRPFVLRHRGATTCVIASAGSGAKRIDRDLMDDTFRAAYYSLAKEDVSADADAGWNL